jgi:two-component system invasion response regulator UvrY
VLKHTATDEVVRAHTTVLVAVQSAEVREGLVAMLGAVEGFHVVGEAATGEQAVELARTCRPHLALIDQELPGMGGWWTIRVLHGERLTRVIVALGRRADGVLAKVAGAQAYVQMGTAPRELLSTLHAALSG